MSEENQNVKKKPERKALTDSVGLMRFHYDAKSGFVFDKVIDEWLTTQEEVHTAMCANIDEIFRNWQICEENALIERKKITEALDDCWKLLDEAEKAMKEISDRIHSHNKII